MGKTMRHRWTALCALGALSLVLACTCPFAQAAHGDTEEPQYWGNIGGGAARVGKGLGEDDGGVAGGVSLSYQKGKNLFSIRGVEVTEFKLDLWAPTGPAATVWDIGVLYGRIARAEHGFASLGAGVALVGISDGYVTFHRAGIPMECQLFWTPGSHLGFGFYGFANLNKEKSFVGALFCLQLRRE
jgi:hypothetical protein